ncbi:hypothetical protein V500_00661, partial [Pseudogymnoascus sp. VKM F-4518 (FW-2643)]
NVQPRHPAGHAWRVENILGLQKDLVDFLERAAFRLWEAEMYKQRDGGIENGVDNKISILDGVQANRCPPSSSFSTNTQLGNAPVRHRSRLLGEEDGYNLMWQPNVDHPRCNEKKFSLSIPEPARYRLPKECNSNADASPASPSNGITKKT